MSDIIGRLEILYSGSAPWTPRATAMIEEELDRCAYSDAEADEAISRLTSRDSRFMPTPAAVITTLAAVRRDQARYEAPEPLSLPEPASMAREWLVKTWGDDGETMTWNEHIRRWHARQNPDGCGSRFCDVFNEHPEPLGAGAVTG